MKKRIIAISLLLVLITVSVSASNKFELKQVFYPIYSNGKLIPEDELPTLSYNDRTYVPLRKLSEASGLGVYFDDKTESISIYNEPLYETQINVLTADVYHDITLVYDCFEDYDHVLTTISEGIMYNYNVANSFDIAANYLEKYLPQFIQQLEDNINALPKIYEVYGYDIDDPSVNMLMIDLEQRLNYAKTAYNYGVNCYNTLDSCVKNGNYDFQKTLYGYNQDGYIYLLGEAYDNLVDSVEEKYDYYIALAIK